MVDKIDVSMEKTNNASGDLSSQLLLLQSGQQLNFIPHFSSENTATTGLPPLTVIQNDTSPVEQSPPKFLKDSPGADKDFERFTQWMDTNKDKLHADADSLVSLKQLSNAKASPDFADEQSQKNLEFLTKDFDKLSMTLGMNKFPPSTGVPAYKGLLQLSFSSESKYHQIYTDDNVGLYSVLGGIVGLATSAFVPGVLGKVGVTLAGIVGGEILGYIRSESSYNKDHSNDYDTLLKDLHTAER